MKVLLIRHAESNGNAAGGDYSVENADALSPKGLRQAEALATCLGSWDITTVIVSPQQRALQTIAPYLAATERTAEVWPELAEACWQEREPPAEAWDSQPAALPYDIAQHFTWRDDQAIRPAWPETFATGLRRVHDALERIEDTFGGSEQTILLASHNFFISEILNLMQRRCTHTLSGALSQALSTSEPEPFHHDNCGMTLMSFDKSWKMDFCNRHPLANPTGTILNRTCTPHVP